MSSEKSGAGNAESQVDWDALARYMAGESSATERAAVQQWLGNQPKDAKVIAALDDALNGLTLGAEATEGIRVEAALAKVNARRAAEPVVPSLRRTGVVARPFEAKSSNRWIPYAAAAALVIAVGVVAVQSKSNPAAPVAIAARTFTTPIGGRDSLLLPDGSSVILGPMSRLTLEPGYGQATRTVSLRGEAYFDVKHDEAHPFVVMASGATVRDLGTAFVVHSDSSGEVRVSVSSGSVELSRTGASASPSAVLHAGDVGTVPTTGDVVAERGAATADDMAWTRGMLVFRDASLAEVRDDLHRWYGIVLVVRDSSMLQRTVTVSLRRDDPVEQVLRNLKLSLPATIDRNGDTAFVRAPETSRRK